VSVDRLTTTLRKLIAWAFWPALVVVVWGELAPPSDVEIHIWDKALHFTAYFGLALIATLAVRAGRPTFWIVLALAAIGGALEFVQGMVGRDMDIYDEFANTLGVLAGAALGWLLVYLHGHYIRQADKRARQS
jgi:VanZ family protein